MSGVYACNSLHVLLLHIRGFGLGRDLILEFLRLSDFDADRQPMPVFLALRAAFPTSLASQCSSRVASYLRS